MREILVETLEIKVGLLEELCDSKDTTIAALQDRCNILIGILEVNGHTESSSYKFPEEAKADE